jgi:hypothetical protein
MLFKKGDDVIVTFDGEDLPGEVMNQSGDYVMCRVLVDPVTDWGNLGPRLSPESTVCVKSASVRLANG